MSVICLAVVHFSRFLRMNLAIPMQLLQQVNGPSPALGHLARTNGNTLKRDGQRIATVVSSPCLGVELTIVEPLKVSFFATSICS